MNTEKTIKDAILAIYKSFEDTNEEAFRALVHPEMRSVNIGNSNEVHIFNVDQISEFTIKGLKAAKESIPGFFSRREDVEFTDVTVEDVVAFVSLRYRMVMPEDVGIHTSGIHLIKIVGKWQVIQIMDRGIEQSA